jgi:hypothetical protein
MYNNALTEEVLVSYYYAICVAINLRIFAILLLNGLADDSSYD